MKKPRLNRWPDRADTEGLLLVAQRLQECLFDYTLDSYKASTLNTHTRCLELLRTIDEINRWKLSAKNLTVIIEELAASIKADSAARALLEHHASDLSSPPWWDTDDLGRLRTQAQFLQGCLWKRRYESELKDQLLALIPTAKEKARILDLTSSLVVEWTHLGFSKEYIYYRAKGFFFGLGGPEFLGPGQLRDFFALFEPKKSSFDVCFRASKGWESLKDDAWRDTLHIELATPPPRADKTREKAFLQKAHDGVYLVVPKIEALDARSARNFAERRLSRLANVAACHVHRGLLKWKPEALVWQDKHPVVLRAPTPAIHKEDEAEPGDLKRDSAVPFSRSTLRDSRLNRGGDSWLP